MSEIEKRKDEHLDLAAHGDVAFRENTTLFEQVSFVHDSLPELAFDELDTSVVVLGKRLRAPLLIAGMTGGTERARAINRDLAALAEERGYAFGLGSQRAMFKDPARTASYEIRDVAPNALVLGNLGVVQAAQMKSEEVAGLARAVGADALCVHMNPAQELVQKDGDRDFRGCLAALGRLTQELDIPVVAKETGCGISPSVARRLRAAGIRHVDVSGAGGTSWVAVEAQRAVASRRELGMTFWDWGIPTAASVALVSGHGFETVFATGGVASGLDVAKAIALGATLGGLARPVLKAQDGGGVAAARELLERIETELRMAMLLAGAKNLKALAQVPRVLGPKLADWLRQAG